MLLNDIGKSPNTTFKKINLHLEANYGFKISEDASDKDLVSIMEQIQDEISELKVKGDDSKASPEISKRLLVLEGIRSLREFAMMQFQSPKLNSVIQNLVDFVVDTFEISGYHGQVDFEKALAHAMDEYRSSRYRFPDDMIEQRVRQEAMAKIQSAMTMEASPVGMMEDADAEDQDEGDDGDSEDDAEMKGVDLEEKHWIHTDPSKRGMFKGKDSGDIEHEKASLKAKDAKHPGHVSAADKTKMHELEFAARAKSGGLEEEERDDDNFGSVGKRASAFGGHATSAPNTPQGQHAMRVLQNPKLSMASQSSNDTQIPMIRDKSGRIVPDPFAAQAAQRRKGIAMKEQTNLVKNLRHLLETEVSQAEVMMAAKGFAQELQEMVEKIGRLQNEDLPPVTDQMRETYGMSSASAFQTQIYGALQGVMDSLYTAKGQVDDAVSNMASTGQFNAQTDMDLPVDGMDDGSDMAGMDADAGAEADLDNLAGDMDAGDEFGGAEEEQPLGRGMKTEAAMQKKVLEMQKLVAKARKLREARG